MAVPIEPWLDKYHIAYRPNRLGNQPIVCPNPTHNDKTPSASLNLDKQLFNCLACGAGGSAVDLVMTVEGIGLRDALRLTEAGSPEGGGEVPRKPGRTSLGLPGGTGNYRGGGKPKAPWAGFR